MVPPGLSISISAAEAFDFATSSMSFNVSLSPTMRPVIVTLATWGSRPMGPSPAPEKRKPAAITATSRAANVSTRHSDSRRCSRRLSMSWSDVDDMEGSRETGGP